MSEGRGDSGCLTVVAAIGLLFILFAFFSGMGQNKPDEGTASAPAALVSAPLDAATLAGCADLLKQGEKLRVIRKTDQAAKRLYVDEPAWRELGPDARRGIAGAALCHWFGIKIGESDFDRAVMVVSWQTGERLSSVAGGFYSDSAD